MILLMFVGTFSSVSADHDGLTNIDPRHGVYAPPAQQSGGGLEYVLQSPLAPGIGSIEALLTTILNVLLVLAVPIIIFFIIFAGFTYVTAQGNPEKIKTATRSLTYAIIGAVLILGGVALSEIIAGVVNSFRT